MKIKTRLYISSSISILGIIGIALFSLMTILMVKEKITLLTSQSTPLQVKTVQFQQAVEKLSADLLQLGLHAVGGAEQLLADLGQDQAAGVADEEL